MKKELITQELEARGIPFHETEVTKGGTKVLGIVLELGRVQPCIYPEGLEDDEDVSEFIDHILNDHSTNKEEAEKLLEAILDFQKVKDMIRISLRPKTDDEERIKKNYLDLEAVVDIFFEEKTIPVKNGMNEAWGVPELKVWEIAQENTRKSVKEAFRYADQMFALSNEEMFKGSGALLFPEAFETYAELIGDDLWLIPSSVHEILVCGKSDMTAEEVTAMIQSVNVTEVDPQDRLSNHPYSYGRFTQTIDY